MNIKKLWHEYANVLLKRGVNIKENQLLVIEAPVEVYEFVRILSEKAYKLGAKDVILRWQDEQHAKNRFEYASIDTLEDIPQYVIDFYMETKNKDASYLKLVGEDPELLKTIAPEKVNKAIQAKSLALKEYLESLMDDENAWTVAAVSIPSWAKAIYPNKGDEEATELLWMEILKASRISESDSVKNWDEHIENLKEKANYLNDMKFEKLHYTNSLGTDVTIELPKGHIWRAGFGETKSGHPFVANIPTEEVYTLPHKYGINGIVYSSKPFIYGGNIIENFSLNIEKGKIVEAKSEKGEKILQKLIQTDSGSSYFGEVALVPYDSPISNRNLLFYNTLFDENASCHLAIGKAYPTCMKDSENKTNEELGELGVNDSIIHEDFMIGTADLTITGIKNSGEQIPVFINGNWAETD